jgi:hypothetical protein
MQQRPRVPGGFADTLNQVVEYQPSLDVTFAAVADPTRRAILSDLTGGGEHPDLLGDGLEGDVEALGENRRGLCEQPHTQGQS